MDVALPVSAYLLISISKKLKLVKYRKPITYRLDASNGKVLNPVTLARLTDDNGITVDFSPDGSKIGIYASKGLYVVDVNLPNQMKMVTGLSG